MKHRYRQDKWKHLTGTARAEKIAADREMRTVDGIIFDSIEERERYELLKRAPGVMDLRCQVKVPLKIYGFRVTVYTIDFYYIERGDQIVEEYKQHFEAKDLLRFKLLIACLYAGSSQPRIKLCRKTRSGYQEEIVSMSPVTGHLIALQKDGSWKRLNWGKRKGRR